MSEPHSPRYCQTPIRVDLAFERLLEEMNALKKFKQEKLKAEWSQIVGEGIARRTTQLYFQENKLFVKVNAASLRNDLNMSKSTLLAAIFSHFKEQIIDEIIIL